jgi:PQQ-like domain
MRKFLNNLCYSLLNIIFTLISATANGQQIAWQKAIAASPEGVEYRLASIDNDEKANAFALDSAGNLYYVVSRYSSSKSINELRVIKLNGNDASPIWDKALNSGVLMPASEVGRRLGGIAADADGNVYVSATFGSSAVLFKISSLTGATIWEYAVPTTTGITYGGNSIKIDSMGNIIFGVTRDLRIAPFGHYGGIIKLSKSGDKIWESYLDSMRSSAHLFALDSKDNILLTTSYYKTDYTDWQTVKLSKTDGRIIWSSAFNGTNDRYDYPTAIGVDNTGSVVVTGSTNVPLNGQRGRIDVKTIKYDGTDGRLIWERTFISSDGGSSAASDMAVNPLGDAYIALSSSDTKGGKLLKYSGTNGETVWSDTPIEPAWLLATTLDSEGNIVVASRGGALGTTTFATIKYAPTGRTIWRTDVPNGYGAQVVVTQNGNTYVGGILSNPANSYKQGLLLAKITDGMPLPTLSVAILGNGAGRVLSSPVGLNCELSCLASYAGNTQVSLVAEPKAGSSFLGWAGGGCIGAGDCLVALNSPKTISAIFRTNALPPLSKRGGIDIDGDGKHSIVLSNASHQLMRGRLVGNSFVFSTIEHSSRTPVLGSADFIGAGKSGLAFRAERSEFGSVLISRDYVAPSVTMRDVKLLWRVDAIGDLDGDGYADLVWRFTGNSGNIDDTGVSYIWFTGINSFSNEPFLSQVRKRGGAPLSWKLLGAIDLNADAAADMIYVSPSGDMRVLMATPSRTCANLSGGTLPGGFSAVKLGDFAGNRAGEILARSSTTGEAVLLSLSAIGIDLPPYSGRADDANASCTASSLSIPQTRIALPTTDPSWNFYASGDLNGDGTADIVWQRTDGSLVVWLMGINGTQPQILSNAGIRPLGYSPILH